MKIKYTLLKYFAFCFLILASSCKSIGQNSSSQQRIQTTLDSLVVSNGIPGINISFINDKKKQESFSSGYENISTKSKLNASHTMFSGSVGKTYVSAIIFQLIDEKRIKLDDKILDYLPKNDWLKQIPNIEDITIEMLISHTSGLPRWVMKAEVWDKLRKEPNKVWTYQDRFSYVFNDDAVHKAGEEWAYSDTNYLLLGYLIEALLEKDYYKVLEERILDPYKLNNTFPSLSRKMERLAFAYSEMPAFFQVPNEVVSTDGKYVFNPQFEWTGGGLASTTADLAKWTNIYYASSIISENQRANMIQVRETGRNVYGEIHSYGMGTFVYNTKFGNAYGHSGFMPGYNTIMAYFPELKLSCAIQINCDYASKNLKLTEYLEICVDAFINS